VISFSAWYNIFLRQVHSAYRATSYSFKTTSQDASPRRLCDRDTLAMVSRGPLLMVARDVFFRVGTLEQHLPLPHGFAKITSSQLVEPRAIDSVGASRVSLRHSRGRCRVFPPHNGGRRGRWPHRKGKTRRIVYHRAYTGSKGNQAAEASPSENSVPGCEMAVHRRDRRAAGYVLGGTSKV
jgi:hypothetical protein